MRMMVYAIILIPRLFEVFSGKVNYCISDNGELKIITLSKNTKYL